MTSHTIYEKDNKQVIVNDKFIYCSNVYIIWNRGAILYEEKYYTSNKPIKLNKKNIRFKQKSYQLYRIFELEYAPEKWLIENNWKIVK